MAEKIKDDKSTYAAIDAALRPSRHKLPVAETGQEATIMIFGGDPHGAFDESHGPSNSRELAKDIDQDAASRIAKAFRAGYEAGAGPGSGYGLGLFTAWSVFEASEEGRNLMR